MDGSRFVDVMARRSGVFLQRGQSCEFINASFRDHLAAFALVRECREDTELAWRRAISHWDDQRWRDMALRSLWLLDQEGINCSDLLRRIPRDTEAGLKFVREAAAELSQIDEDLKPDIMPPSNYSDSSRS